MTDALAGGTAHPLPPDLADAIARDPRLGPLWQALTPLGRNEFICRVEDARRPATRAQRIARTGEELLAGKRRPCCWPGCIHRTDKPPGAWQRAVLIEGRAGRR